MLIRFKKQLTSINSLWAWSIAGVVCAFGAFLFSQFVAASADEPIFGALTPGVVNLAAGIQAPSSEPPKPKPAIELELGSIELKNLSGNSVSSKNLENKKIVLYFWSIYCRGCSPITKDLVALKQQMEDENIIFLPVHLFESSPEKIRAELARLGLNLPILLAPKGVRDVFSVRMLPASLVFDGSDEHKLLARFDGMLDSEGLKLELLGRVETK